MNKKQLIINISNDMLNVENPDMIPDDLMVSALMGAYLNVAMEFIENHDPECKGCPAYEIANRVSKSIERIQKDIQEKYNNNF